MDAPVWQLPGAATAPPSGSHVERFEFSGSGAEYFRIWIVNLLLTVVTLGIYSAWAKVRKLRYFYGNTTLAGSSFEYHGRPLQLLKGRLIAASVLIPYFVVARFYPPWHLLFVVLFLVAMPFLVVKSRRFSSRMTSWRNIRFDFTGTYRRAAGVYLGGMLLTAVTFGLYAPYWIFSRQRFLIGETHLGATQLDFQARAVDYYVAVLLGGLIIVGGAMAVSFAAVPLLLLTSAAPSAEDWRAFMIMPFILLAYLLGFAFMNARLRNAAFSNTRIGEHKLDCRLQTWRLFGLYLTNALAALVSLGLLIPWAQIRLMRYQLESMSVAVDGNLDAFVGVQRSHVSAAGEELGDLLDVDFGL